MYVYFKISDLILIGFNFGGLIWILNKKIVL